MTGRRPGQEPFEAIEAGIRQLRFLGLGLLALVVTLPSGHRPNLIGLALLLPIAGLMVTASRSSLRLAAGRGRVDRAVAFQIGADVIATVGTLLILDPGPGDGLWLIVALPVVEGAIRHGLLGALMVWLAAAVPSAGWTIVTWAPGDGLATVVETAGVLSVALAIGLPAGLAAERLVDELGAQDRGRAELDEQAHLIATLAVASTDLAAATQQGLGQTLVDAAVELGFPGAEMTVVDLTNGSQQLLASEPPGFATAALANIDRTTVAVATPGSVHASGADELVGILAKNGNLVAFLAVGADEHGRWRPRGEAFELLCRSGAAAMTTIDRRRQLTEASRDLDRRWRSDPVTGMLNRASFEAAVGAVLHRLIPGAEIQVIAIDLDGFAIVNSANGWAAGDEVLAEIGARLTRSSPDGAGVARLQADRFAIVTDDRGAGELAAHLHDVLARPIATSSGAVVVRASIGKVLSADPSSAPVALIREAELRSRAAKGPASTREQTMGRPGA